MNVESQLKHLDSTLLGPVTSEFPQPLTDEDRALTNAYLVLAHAVLEEHLEWLFERHYDRLAGWLTADMVPLEAARLAFAVGSWTEKDVTVGYPKRSLHGQVAKASRKNFVRQIQSNHGLKAENVQALAKWIGLDWGDFENELAGELADLSNLGARRGLAGHLSPYSEKVTALTTNDDPEEIRRWVQAGQEAVSRIGAYLNRLVDSQQPSSLISDWDGN